MKLHIMYFFFQSSVAISFGSRYSPQDPVVLSISSKIILLYVLMYVFT
jgi:hypothetical protein